MEPEIWKQWPGLGPDGRYWISDTGRVKNSDGHLLVTPIRGSGYQYVVLSLGSNENKKLTPVHTLVCETFHGPRPEGMVCRHLDGDPLNNCSENLAWGTQSENMHDAVRHGRIHQANKTHCIRDHPLSGDNLRIRTRKNGNTERVCRECARNKAREYAAKNRESSRKRALEYYYAKKKQQ